MKPAAIVLAAGEARRFGSPKQLALLRGEPLLQHVLDAVNAAPGVGEILLVLGARADEINAKVRLGRARVVRCDDWREGMAASLRAGAAALAPDAAGALILLGDQPLVTPELIQLLLDRAAAESAGGHAVDAVRVSYDGVPGHPVLLGRKVLARIPTLRGDVGARDLLSAAEVRLVESLALGSGADVDTPEQLAALTDATPHR